MEVCLRALGKPGAPIKYAVDFSNLPSVPVPSAAACPSSGSNTIRRRGQWCASRWPAQR